MKVYLDTSSLVKLYHFENGTEYIEAVLVEFPVSKIVLSELTKIELRSAIWKKVRTKDLMIDEANAIVNAFQNDYGNFSIVKVTHELVNQAVSLMTKYGIAGLRTLDSIQLASVVSLKSELKFAVTSDVTLQRLLDLEGISTK